jgi:hypothetical protein
MIPKQSSARVAGSEEQLMNENRGCSSVGMALVGVLVSVLYLSNLTFGIIEIPDNLPLIGNLDEVFFSGVLFASLARLGIRLPFTGSRDKVREV